MNKTKTSVLSLLALVLLSGPASAFSTASLPGKLSLPSPVKSVPALKFAQDQFKPFTLGSVGLLELAPGGVSVIKGGKGLDGRDGLAGVFVPAPKTPKLPTLSAAEALPIAEKLSETTLRILFDSGKTQRAVVALEAVLVD